MNAFAQHSNQHRTARDIHFTSCDSLISLLLNSRHMRRRIERSSHVRRMFDPSGSHRLSPRQRHTPLSHSLSPRAPVQLPTATSSQQNNALSLSQHTTSSLHHKRHSPRARPARLISIRYTDVSTLTLSTCKCFSCSTLQKTCKNRMKFSAEATGGGRILVLTDIGTCLPSRERPKHLRRTIPPLALAPHMSRYIAPKGSAGATRAVPRPAYCGEAE